MYVPPILIYIVGASYLVGLLLPFVFAAWGQRGRSWALTGVFGGSLLSIPAGVLSGSIFWNYLAGPLGDGVSMVVGPLMGCFFGTLVATLIIRELAVWIATVGTQRLGKPDKCSSNIDG